MNKYYKLIHNDNAENGPLQLKNISNSVAEFSMVADGTPSDTPDLDYSLDGTTWSAYDFTTLPTIEVPVDGQIYLKGTNTYGFMPGEGNGYSIHMNQNYDIIGNLMSIIDATDYATKTSSNERVFTYLFRNETHLIHSHQANCGNVATFEFASCKGTFQGCTNLLTPIDLSKVTYTSEASFQIMFYGCTSLLYCPDFSGVKNVQSNTFDQTFSGCTSLKEGADFSNIKENINSGDAFYQTFYGCTSLETPALIGNLYSTNPYEIFCEMYYGCTSLKEGMDIRGVTYAKTDSDGMRNMYNGCTSLMTAYVAPTYLQDTSSWLYNVASGGTLYLPYGFTLPIGDSGVPSNWTVVYY